MMSKALEFLSGKKKEQDPNELTAEERAQLDTPKGDSRLKGGINYGNLTPAEKAKVDAIRNSKK